MTITLKQFTDKYNGVGLDFDGWFGDQCADLAQYYAKEVVGAPAFTGNGAVDFYDTYDASYYTRIANTEENFPIAGDVVIWKQDKTAGTGQFGHVAIAVSATKDMMHLFSQNWPTGTKCHFIDLGFAGVRGWLRPPALAVHLPTIPISSTPATPAAHPPQTSTEAIDVALRHLNDLKMHPNLEAANKFFADVAKWPHFTK